MPPNRRLNRIRAKSLGKNGIEPKHTAQIIHTFTKTETQKIYDEGMKSSDNTQQKWKSTKGSKK